MSAERPRPWHNPTPLIGFTPDWAGQFDSFRDWVVHAPRALSTVLGSVEEILPAFCIDAKGRRCHVGKDFMRARDENAFPVRYFWVFTLEKSMSLTDKNGVAWAHSNTVKVGDKLRCDGDFTCMCEGSIKEVKRREGARPHQSSEAAEDAFTRLYIECTDGEHYLDGQLGDGGALIGLYPA